MHQVPDPTIPPQGVGYPKWQGRNGPFFAFHPRAGMPEHTIHILALVYICFHMYAHICVCVYFLFCIFMHLQCIGICMHMHSSVCICIHMDACAYFVIGCMFTFVHAHAYASICLHAFVCIHQYEAYVCIGIHILSPASAHIHRGGFKSTPTMFTAGKRGGAEHPQPDRL